MIETLVVDGYNIIHAIPELEAKLDESLKSARGALEKTLRQYQATERSIKCAYVVYDSRRSEKNEIEIEDLGFVKNIYASSKSNADGEIVSLLKNIDRPARVAVLSKDNFVINHTRIMGAHVLSVGAFHKKITKHKRRTNEAKISEEQKEKISEEQKEKINQELKRIWAIK